ncbi:MAG: hypothetical protein A2504_05080 [Bdellovibrionales bacterium RIFOXYD12_FULL_39_22]|nr:MAG: hypothetical protein A2385_06745 [Bdellovibrionales bacterium RIFOXYB1_FULL_39_21]OFZ41969.1 MAG: hypothetical protein A2485_08715 [Bdellovibrionales bacterium RIFOXYC12_FULL_39_17]OFZ50685.1 MAG: hypothetical protein A2404_05665 [Bdellovibrionales bacterium RIFOXYC1_FULL_39_130]OFZ73753.1 MAG: hypothetical protein A2451_02350 [Bdellovibrionales bacterium RIFOXYC2_FULL_39_8]OFZ77908.1 MAG: hypothetical protein A2560_00835 [Bdellovibrionales bacterium RIFOXYD1_FULL_39_84]OFZ93656.1 MAG:
MAENEDLLKDVVVCYACKKHLDIEVGQKISRQEECIYCHVSLRCCRMCNYYSTTVYNECRESMAERVLDKERINFCSYFEIRRGQDKEEEVKKAILSKASSLFKD